MEENRGRQLIFFCCILFFLLLFFSTQQLSRATHPGSSFYLFRISSGSLAIVDSSESGHHETGAVPAFLSPFYFQAIPINSCDKNLLLTISGIGPSLAEHILLVRAKIGNFRDMHDLLLVPGIGKKRMLQFARSFNFAVGGCPVN